MLVSAAFVPDTALLVPGASGRVDPAQELREAATSAVRRALDGADRVVVVAPGRPPGRPPRAVPPGGAGATGAGTGTTSPRVPALTVVGTVRPTLAAAGVPDRLLAPVAPVTLSAVEVDEASELVRRTRVAAVPTAVALRVLAAVGGAATHAVETVGADAAALRALGARLVAGDGRDALVVVGSGSARHGPDAPVADDPEALVLDDALLADLSSPDAAARERLSAIEPERAVALAVTGWGPWQVLLGALGPRRVRHCDVAGLVLLGAQHVVGTWRVEAPA